MRVRVVKTRTFTSYHFDTFAFEHLYYFHVSTFQFFDITKFDIFTFYQSWENPLRKTFGRPRVSLSVLLCGGCFFFDLCLDV